MIISGIRAIVIKVLYYLLAYMRWCTVVLKQHFLSCPERSILRSVLFWDFMQHRTVILYRWFRTNYWSHLRGTYSLWRLPGTRRYAHTILYMNCVPKCSQNSSWIAWPLKMGLTVCPKTWAWNYHSTLHKIPEGHGSHVHCSVSRESWGMSWCRSGSFLWNSDM